MVRIQGLRNVRPSFLAGLCRPYVDASSGVTPFSAWWYGERASHALPGEPTTFKSLLDITTALGGDLDGRRGLRRLRGRLLSAGLVLIGSPLRDLVGLRHGTPPGVVHAVARPRAVRPGSSCLCLRLLRAGPGDEAVS